MALPSAFTRTPWAGEHSQAIARDPLAHCSLHCWGCNAAAASMGGFSNGFETVEDRLLDNAEQGTSGCRSVYLDRIEKDGTHSRLCEHSPQLPQGFTPVSNITFWPGMQLPAPSLQHAILLTSMCCGSLGLRNSRLSVRALMHISSISQAS